MVNKKKNAIIFRVSEEICELKKDERDLRGHLMSHYVIEVERGGQLIWEPY